MTSDVVLLPEPDLIFGNGNKCIDPKIGLLNYGPCGQSLHYKDPYIIKAGAIGNPATLSQLKSFLSRLTNVIAFDRNNRGQRWKVDFPGLGYGSPLGFSIELDPEAIEYIKRSEESDALSSSIRKRRIENYYKLYKMKMEDLINTTHPKPLLVFFPWSMKLISQCKDPKYAVNRIICKRKTLEKPKFQTNVPLFNLHHALKVLSFQHDVACQIVLPHTMTFSNLQEDAATTAWNFSAATYYKATGSPWKLTDIDDRTCLVGISFYEEISPEGEGLMRASMAHVYMKTAESQIIRGKPFKWEQSHVRQRSPHLNIDQSRDLLDDVINLFVRQRDCHPTRVVVHKSSPYTDDEIQGFDEACQRISIVDYIHIPQKHDIRLFHMGDGSPPVRGSCLFFPEHTDFFLSTVGFVPALGTYLGMSVPIPLLLKAYRLDSSIIQVSNDILALTKLDWNTTSFCSRLPVTLSVSRKVGEILSEMRSHDIEPPQPYRYYM